MGVYSIDLRGGCSVLHSVAGWPRWNLRQSIQHHCLAAMTQQQSDLI